MNFIPRDDAVRAIAGHLADRDAFVINAPPAFIPGLAERLVDIPGWTAYLDNGTPIVMRVDGGWMFAASVALVSDALGSPLLAVLAVPKTVPARVLGKALGQKIARDGSQDILNLTKDGLICWPMLFVDALTQVDPSAAAQLRANDIATAS